MLTTLMHCVCPALPCRRVLVMEVNRLKVRQEKMELEELQNMDENQLSFL